MIAAATSSPPTDPTAPSKEKKEKKPKKETTAGVTGDKSSGKKAAPPAAAAADAGEPSPAMIDLRVGHIVDGKSLYCETNDTRFWSSLVKKHPDADGLYVEVRCHQSHLVCSHSLQLEISKLTWGKKQGQGLSYLVWLTTSQ